MSFLPAVLDSLRLEGVRSSRDRLLDRLEESRCRRSYRTLAGGAAASGCPFAPVLNVSPVPPVARLGGVPLSMSRRRIEEAKRRGVALLYPYGRAWRLEVEGAGRRVALCFPASAPPNGPAEHRDPAFERAVLAACAAVGARAIHVENLSGMSLASLRELAGEGLRLAVTVQDFTPYCPRQHLLAADGVFCGYCDDEARCLACLRSAWPVPAGFSQRWRASAAALLCRADAVCFPSPFLRDRYRELIPALEPARLHVIPPSGPGGLPGPRRPISDPPHIAFAGSAARHKGAHLLPAVVAELAPLGARWSVYGGLGDAELLARAGRVPGVRIRGYCRAGSLTAHLTAARVDVALLLSIVPEAHCLTLDECLAAGVPVVAFDLGALGARIARLGGGRLVAAGSGAAGIAGAVRDVLAGELSPAARVPLPDARTAAAAHLELYRSLGVALVGPDAPPL